MAFRKILIIFLTALPLLAACQGIGSPTARYGMVKNPDTGLMFGSVVDGAIVTDASLFKNNKLKVRIRNTSGDVNFDLKKFSRNLTAAYALSGYEPTKGNDFGLLLNINVVYSGQVQTNLSNEYAFLGAAAGSLYGYRSKATAGAAIGAAAGATLGSIVGSFVTDDTYIVIVDVSISQIKNPAKRDGKSVTFSRSIAGNIEDNEDREERRKSRKIKKTTTVKVAAYAGGRNTRQSEIAEQVRQRLVRIIGDII